MPTDTEYRQLLEQAVEAFNKLTPAQKAAHRKEQAISFAYGQVDLLDVSLFFPSVWERLSEE